MNATQADTVRMRESARNVMELVGRAVRQANYRLHVDAPLASPALDGTDGTGNGSTAVADVLVVRHDPVLQLGQANPRQGVETNCEGGTVTSNNNVNPTTGAIPANPVMVEYRFSVVNNTLVCQADPDLPTSAGAVVAENVENFQISYGIGNGTETIVNYVDQPSALQFTQVSAVRVSLLLRGPTPGVVPGGSQSITFNGLTETKTDGFLRQVVTSTFTIRNQTRWQQ